MCITQHPNCMHHIADCIVIVKSRTDDWTKQKKEYFGGAGVRASAFHLWDGGFDSRYGLMWKESVTDTLPKVVGFHRVLRFPPTGKVGRVG
jgi:hypothetical protein